MSSAFALSHRYARPTVNLRNRRSQVRILSGALLRSGRSSPNGRGRRSSRSSRAKRVLPARRPPSLSLSRGSGSALGIGVPRLLAVWALWRLLLFARCGSDAASAKTRGFVLCRSRCSASTRPLPWEGTSRLGSIDGQASVAARSRHLRARVADQTAPREVGGCRVVRPTRSRGEPWRSGASRQQLIEGSKNLTSEAGSTTCWSPMAGARRTELESFRPGPRPFVALPSVTRLCRRG